MSFGGINTFQQYSNDYGMGNNGVKITFNYFDGLPDPNLLNALNSNDLKLIFKSLMKRDDVTKEKAVTDLFGILTETDHKLEMFDDIFLLCWSQIYAKLIINESKSIRCLSNSITIMLIKQLNKKIGKFLKDFIPLVLMGTCDTDLYVSKKCTKELLNCFNNDTKKIDMLWTMFYEQILNLCKQVIVIEEIDTLSDERYVKKEEATFKYNRILLESVHLIILLLQSNPKGIEDFTEIYHDILNEESLWGNISLSSAQNTKLLDKLLNLVRILYNNQYLLKNTDILKIIVRRIFKIMRQISSKNILSFNSVVPSIINTVSLLSDYKNGKLWSYDKKSKISILNLLSVAIYQPVPNLYASMNKLFNKITAYELFDFSTELLPIWQEALTVLNTKSFLGKYGSQLIQEFWRNYISFLENSPDDLQQKIINDGIFATLKSKVSLCQSHELCKLFSQYCGLFELENNIKLICDPKRSMNEEDFKGEENYLTNMMVLLSNVPANEQTITDLANWALDTISNDNSTIFMENQHILNLFIFVIDTNNTILKNEISRLIYELPLWLENSTFDVLANVIIKYSNSKFIDLNEEWLNNLQDFFTSALSLDISKSKIIDLLDQLNPDKLRDFLASSNGLEVNFFISSYLKSYCFKDNGAFLKSHLFKINYVPQLYTNTKHNNRLDILYNIFPQLKKAIQIAFLTATTFFTDILLENVLETHEDIKNTILLLSKNDDNIAQVLANGIMDFVGYSSIDSKFIQFTFELINNNISILDTIIPENLGDVFFKKVSFIDYRCSLSNPLGSNLFLLPVNTKSFDLSEIRSLLNYGLFLDRIMAQFSEYLDDNCIVFLSLIVELAIDYNYICEIADDTFYDIKNTVFKADHTLFDFSEMLEKMVVGPSDGNNVILNCLIKEANPVLAYYKSRIIHRLLMNSLDLVSPSALASKIPLIEKYVSSVIRGKESTDSMYLHSAVILSVVNNYAVDDSLIKLRTLLSSECIGVRPSELVNKSYKILLLLNNLLEFQETDTNESFMPIAPQRLTIILKTINQWLDSEIAYDDEFLTLRIGLLRFFSCILSIPQIRTIGDIINNIAIRLLTDSISMCQIDETLLLFHLRLECLHLNDIMSKFNLITENETIEELANMLSEMAMHTYHNEQNNQISRSFYSSLTKQLLSIKSKYLLTLYSQFFAGYMGQNINQNVNQKRLLMTLLLRLIYEKQQEKVIEFELQKQSVSQSTDEMLEHHEEVEEEKKENMNEYKIPTELINSLHQNIPTEYLEYDNEYDFIKYLWDWVLTLTYFKDVSYKMRQIYIDQLKDHDLIKKMFDFITEQINFEDKDFWKDISESDIRQYDPSNNDFSPYKDDITLECHKLLSYLLYELFNNVGSLTSNWFLNIRSRSEQQAIEKFVSTKISPILIKDELDKVEKKLDYLTSKDDDLTIKINRITNETKASYLIDEQKLELAFKLPSNYPLSNIQVIGVSRVGISEQKWKQWIMSTQHVITGMNGSVLDSLELFTKNVHLQFSGFEECAICYSILHAVDRKLPNKTCPTCKNRFHGACLYKWFRSSGNNTCPLCRTEIAFRR
ncbi:hypothetical protein RI543_000598 [Arxiozyma heterogenica]|uniref:E3 ubiquitin-protein ligase listerin n=1 Tax=Arxiozyma heterogenica TaxID=278026 RepID=A0AAN7WP58_9SACH|nr:hypothetical protein RI543_000598 [Kazachstania heterogenica]